MDYETSSSSSLSSASNSMNHSFLSEMAEAPARNIMWVLLLKLGLPSYLPYLLLGPSIQLIATFLIYPYTPSSVLTSNSKRMKWRTTFIARISAAITGSWAALVMMESSAIRSDLMFSSSTSAIYLVVFSVGVHLAEAIDMLLYCKPSMLLLHHVMVIICFVGALITQKAIGFAVLSLVTEINAVFNKTRILHIITGIASDSDTYKRNALVNVITFFIRILIIGWMNNQCFFYLDVLPLSFLAPCIVGLGIVNVWNLSVFKTLLKKDILSKHKAI